MLGPTSGVLGEAQSRYLCALCNKTFQQNSSLVRHSKKCTLDPRPSLRQKACKCCTVAKVRCDTVRPTCSRCASRGVACVYVRPVRDAPARLPTPPVAASQPQTPQAPSPFLLTAGELASLDNGGSTASSDWFLGNPACDGSDMSLLDPELGQNCLDLSHESTPRLGSPPRTPDELDSWVLAIIDRPVDPTPDPLIQHSMRTLFRVFRTWPHMLAKGFQLPPMIHPFQFKDGTPGPLANCITLSKMWSGQVNSASPIVEDTIQKEVYSILSKYRTFDQPTLLASFQAISIYITMLLFPSPAQTSFSIIPRCLFNDIQTMAFYVASTGLVLQDEADHARPDWLVWAHVEAKRRARLVLYLLHWAYSVYHSLAHFDCRELSRMPAPAAKFLWQAADEASWDGMYRRWLAQWDGCEPMQADLLTVGPAIAMGRRMEMWLEDADELGVLVIALLNATDRNMSHILDG